MNKFSVLFRYKKSLIFSLLITCSIIIYIFLLPKRQIPKIFEVYFGEGTSQLVKTNNSYEIYTNNFNIKILSKFKSQGINYALLQIDSDINDKLLIPWDHIFWENLENKNGIQSVVLSTSQDNIEISQLLTNKNVYTLSGRLQNDQSNVEWIDNSNLFGRKKDTFGILSERFLENKSQPFSLSDYGFKNGRLHLQFYGSNYDIPLDDFKNYYLENSQTVYLIDLETNEKILPIEWYPFSKSKTVLNDREPYYLEFIFDVENLNNYGYEFSRNYYTQVDGEFAIDFSDIEELPVLLFEPIENDYYSLTELQLSPISMQFNSKVIQEEMKLIPIEIIAILKSGEEVVLKEIDITNESNAIFKIPFINLDDIEYLKVDGKTITSLEFND